MAVSEKITKDMRRRLCIWLLGIILLVTVYVGIRMYNVAVKESEKYQALANSQQFRSTTVKANRGTIYDQNGQVLAQSVTVYTVYVDPRTFAERDRGKNSTLERQVPGRKDPEKYEVNREEYIVSTLSLTLDLPAEEIRQKLYKTNAYQVIKKEVDKASATTIMKAMAEAGITSVGATPTAKRYYPQNDLAANVIGHLHYDGYGFFGLEAYYDDYLTGVDGRIISARDATGAEFMYKYKQSYEAKDGCSVYTNLDTTIQYYTEKALENAVLANNPKDRSCAIVMNAKTGAIYAMAVEPDYDLNNPFTVYDTTTAAVLAGLQDVDPEGYNKLRLESLNLQWNNKAISSTYFPGSVFKVVTGSAALEENAIKLNDSFYCNGVSTVDGIPIHCWTTYGGHGTQNFVQAMTNSCNPAFIKIGQALGAKLFCKYFEAFGLTQKTGIDLPAEINSWYAPYSAMTPVTLATSSFGQTNKITPIQMICAYAAVINGGYLVTPYVVDKIVDCDGNIVKEMTPTIKRQVISEDTSALMRETLEAVVNTNSGTNVYIKGYHIGGKSGTSQKLDDNREGDTYVSSYCAFYPAEDPEIIMLVMVDEPRNGRYYGSAVAAPVISEVFAEILPYLGYYAEYTEDELSSLEVNVPNVQGGDLKSAKATIEACGLKYDVVGKGDKVVKQVPSRGNSMPKGCTIILYTEEDYEEDLVYVPNIEGYSLEKANKKLAALGLNLKPLGGAAYKAGAECTGGMNYVDCYVPKGTIIEAYFLLNNETG